MTAFWANKKYYELTLFMDLFNNEIIAFALSDKRGDPNTYHLALKQVLNKKEEYKDFDTVLHTDHGSVYSSKKFNQSLPSNHIIHSMSKPGKPTENGAWNLLMVGLKKNYSLILKLILLMIFITRLKITFTILIMKDFSLLSII